MAIPQTENVFLFQFDGATPLVESAVYRLSEDVKERFDPSNFGVGPPPDRRRRYRYFKKDLTLSDGKLNVRLPRGTAAKSVARRDELIEGARADWSMPVSPNLYYQEGRDGGVIRTDELFSPTHAAEAFVSQYCSRLEAELRGALPNLEAVEFRFSRPSYRTETERKAFSEHVRSATERVEGSEAVTGAFPSEEADWLYEAYGVFYYYASVEGVIDASARAATHLVVDVGGSTTDLAVVQTAKTAESQEALNAVPVGQSVGFAGRDVDLFLTRRLFGKAAAGDDEAVESVERAKVALCRGAGAESVTYKEETKTIHRAWLEEALEVLWTNEKLHGIGIALDGLLDTVRRESEENSLYSGVKSIGRVLLAGGSSELPGLRQYLARRLGSMIEGRSLDEVFVFPKAPPSALASIGFAWYVASRVGVQLATASQLSFRLASCVYMQLRVNAGPPMGFQRLGDGQLRAHPTIRETSTVVEVSSLRAKHRTHTETQYRSLDATPDEIRGVWEYRLHHDKHTEADLELLPWDLLKTKDQLTEMTIGRTALVSLSAAADALPGRVIVEPRLFARSEKGADRVRIDARESKSPLDLSVSRAVTGSVGGQRALVCVDLGMSNTVATVVLSEGVAGTALGASFLPLASALASSVPATGDVVQEAAGEQEAATGMDGALDELIALRAELERVMSIVAASDAEVARLTEELESESKAVEEAIERAQAEADRTEELVADWESARRRIAAEEGARVPYREAAEKAERAVRELEAVLEREREARRIAEENAHESLAVARARLTESEEQTREARAEVETQESLLEARDLAAETAEQRVRDLEAELTAERESALPLGAGGDGAVPVTRPPMPYDAYTEEVCKYMRVLAAGTSDAEGENPAVETLVERFERRLAAQGEGARFFEIEPHYSAGRESAWRTVLRFDPDLVRSILAEVTKEKSRLVVLSGPPGTGKSSLVRAVCALLNPDVEHDPDAMRELFCLQPVSPSWLTPSNLLGWYSEVDGRFHRTPFWEFLARATYHEDQMREVGGSERMFCVCLDEFNLARPEHYLSEVLSRMESFEESPVIPVAEEALGKAANVRLPGHVKLFATVNVDASGHPLSPKVMDRSLYLTVSAGWPALRQHLDDHLFKIKGDARTLDTEDDTLQDALVAFEKALKPPGATEGLVYQLYALAELGHAPFGHRVLDMAMGHVRRYVALFPPSGTGVEAASAYAQRLVDDLLCGFFLPKLPSAGEVANPAYRDRLSNLRERCGRVRPDGAWLSTEARALGVFEQLKSQYRSGQMAWHTSFPEVLEASEGEPT